MLPDVPLACIINFETNSIVIVPKSDISVTFALSIVNTPYLPEKLFIGKLSANTIFGTGFSVGFGAGFGVGIGVGVGFSVGRGVGFSVGLAVGFVVAVTTAVGVSVASAILPDVCVSLLHAANVKNSISVSANAVIFFIMIFSSFLLYCTYIGAKI